VWRVCTGDAAVERGDVNKQLADRRRQLPARSHDWLLSTDTERLMRLLGQARVSRDQPAASWLLPPSTPVDWRAGRRRARPAPAPLRRAISDNDRPGTVTTTSSSVNLLPTTVNEHAYSPKPDHKK